MWRPGDRVAHRFNPELGPGMVTEVESRRLTVFFPDGGDSLTIAADSDVLEPLRLAPGLRAKVESSGETVLIEDLDGDQALLADGRLLDARELWPIPNPDSPVDILVAGRLDALADFANRLDGVRLERLRRSGGLGSFLGGRIDLFPHQLYTAERATRALDDGRPVRWLLADEVGLGKTVEACLILNRLMHVGAAETVLVIAPETLIVQWLGELWRKYHRIFVLIDDARLADVRREHGRKTNPFDIYRHAIVSFEHLVDNPWLARRAKKADFDLVVVDEAHHLRRPPRQKGSGEYRAVAPILKGERHALLLTATPLEDDAHGFFRLLQLLRPDALPKKTLRKHLKKRLRAGEPLPPCTSATRRSDIGGLPPRLPIFVDLDERAWQPIDEIVNRLRKAPKREKRGARRRRVRRLRKALASPAAVADKIRDAHLQRLAEKAQDTDPRLAWLVEHARGWRTRREKTLVFVPDRLSLDWLADSVRTRAHVDVGVFHEELTPQRRDLEVARFRADDGPALMVSTEAGGEGRNFQFCTRLVLFDLPWSPSVTEQRIGRLDRIGRDRPTEIVVFRPPRGFPRALVDLYDSLGLFREPLGGLTREMGRLAREIERVAVSGPRRVDASIFDDTLSTARKAIDRIQKRAYRELHRAPYREEMADDILARVPDDLDRLTEEVVLRACERFGFSLEASRGSRVWHLELGAEALVDRLPGVSPGSTFVGTFERALAVDDETLDFFASGHPLVEGVLAELEDGQRGRVALFEAVGQVAHGPEPEGLCLLALYAGGRGPDAEALPEAVVIDDAGRRRDHLARALLHRELALRPVDAKAWTAHADWTDAIRALASELPSGDTPTAVAAFRVRRP